jgi:Xaa-Pro aminopeptidase
MTPSNPPVFKADLYRQRRAELAGRIREQSGGGIAILSTAAEQLRNRDSEFPYRHDSDFFTSPDLMSRVQPSFFKLTAIQW